jgi:U3 small nucleolar RNA-associated protein 10
VSYYSYLLDSTLSILRDSEFGLKTYESIQLWKFAVSSLEKYFLYDQGLLDDKKFEKLMKPLVDQMDYLDSHGDDYMENMFTILIPCISQLAVTAKTEARRKPLNKLICMKTRTDSKEIRLVSLQVLKKFYSRVGEEMLVFFPETIPFIAELMEDDEEEVEHACKDLCLEIQNYLGEDIQQYFNAQ